MNIGKTNQIDVHSIKQGICPIRERVQDFIQLFYSNETIIYNSPNLPPNVFRKFKMISQTKVKVINILNNFLKTQLNKLQVSFLQVFSDVWIHSSRLFFNSLKVSIPRAPVCAKEENVVKHTETGPFGKKLQSFT